MNRRKLITLMGGVAAVWPFSARGQSIKKMPKVGVLWHAGSAEQEAPYFGSLLEGFKNLGYVDGLNIAFEHRFPNEIPERFKSMGAELVSLEIDVLVVVGNNAAPYATNLTKAIPVVFTLVGDPIGLNLVTSLARPGGNITGLANFTAELIPKRLELLKDIVPGLSRVALLANMRIFCSCTFSHSLDPYRKSALGNRASGRVQFRPSTRHQISDVHPADRMPRGSTRRFEAT
jgi:putative tryptophan/tyrosine transport system substrate-binding protein